MLGPEGVARALVGRLVERVPAKLAEMRTRLGVDTDELPDLHAVYATEVDILALTNFPCMAVVEYDTTGRLGNRQLDTDGVFDEYQYRYRMRVFCWGMANGHVETDLLRKRLILAAREVLLSDKILHDDEAGGQYAESDAQTLRESFSDIGERAERQFLGGAYLELEVATQERLYLAEPGATADISATYQVVGKYQLHPGDTPADPVVPYPED